MNISFDNATNFRKSLEARLKNIAIATGEDLQRLRRKVAFDRFLARLSLQKEPKFLLKGGYAMELRLSTARATKDIDLTCTSRVKDLNDIVLLMRIRSLDLLVLKHALHLVFKIRKTHSLPRSLEPLPNEWDFSYAKLAKECAISSTYGELIIQAWISESANSSFTMLFWSNYSRGQYKRTHLFWEYLFLHLVLFFF